VHSTSPHRTLGLDQPPSSADGSHGSPRKRIAGEVATVGIPLAPGPSVPAALAGELSPFSGSTANRNMFYVRWAGLQPGELQHRRSGGIDRWSSLSRCSWRPTRAQETVARLGHRHIHRAPASRLPWRRIRTLAPNDMVVTCETSVGLTGFVPAAT
jgi:hypothetical protein